PAPGRSRSRRRRANTRSRPRRSSSPCVPPSRYRTLDAPLGAFALSLHLSVVVPAQAGTHIPEASIAGTMGFPLRAADSGVIWITPFASIRADAGLPDRLGPALDLLGQELGEIFGRAALGRHDLEAELLQPLAHRGIVEGVAHRLVELAHDRLGRALGQEERVPDRGLDAGQALLAGGGEVGDDRYALLPPHRDVFGGGLA